jgi:PAS domain S-box-containing protein
MLIHAALDGTGWDVAEVHDASVLLELGLELAGVDIAVVDAAIADGGMIEFVTRFREQRPDMSILVLAAGPGTAEGIAALLAGADDFLSKPIVARELMARLGAAARRRVRGTQSRSRLQEIITGVTSEVTDAVVITTSDHRIRSFNRAAEDLYGFRAEDVALRPVSEVVRWAGAEADIDEAQATLTERGSWHGVAEHYRSDGSIVRVRSSTQALYDQDGNEMGVISVNRRFEAPPTDAERRAFEVGQAEIAAGLAADEFSAHFQPIFRIEDRGVVGFEALARWQHGAELRLPKDFIQTAEGTDLILEIGAVVLTKACAQLRLWQEAGHDLYLTVNVAARQLLDPEFVDSLEHVLGASGTEARRLTLEVTETAVIQDIDTARRALLRIASLGVGVSIDDFGTGWASLTYLRQLPVTCLKIDRSFVAGLGVDHRDTAIVRSVIALGQELDLLVIAEGVETEAQLQHLELLGCKLAQGYLVARPTPASEIALPAVVVLN